MRPDPSTLPRTIGFWGASAVMVGIVIGSGIFRTPSDIARETGSPMLVLSLWALGGVLSLFGALTYAELAVMYPESGGVYIFLREGFGRAVAFVFGWTYMLISKPLAAAGIAIIFAQHFNELCLGVPASNQPAASLTTSVLLVVLTAINVRGLRLGGGIAGVLTTLKVLALLGIVALALALCKGSAANFESIPDPKPWWLALAPIMAGVLWTYDGWSDAGSIAGEVRDPARELPRIYLVGTVFLIAIYVAVNAVYIALVPLSEMRAGDTVAPLVMQRLIGNAGAVAVAVVVIVSTLGSTHGSIITGARITYAQARDGLLFRFLGRVHPRFKTPAVSLWAQCLLSCVAVWYYGNFADLAGGFVFTMWIFYGLAGSVIFVLRRRNPGAPRAYRCWGYPIVPGLFVLSAAAMTAMSIYQAPLETGVWLGILAAGFPVYLVWSRLFPRPGGG
jgi:APA family basic amino acid/polyamine antiporter